MRWFIAASLAAAVVAAAGVGTWADEPPPAGGRGPVVVATWEHQVKEKNGAVRKGTMKLYSNGHINDPAGKATWAHRGNTLVLRWPDAKAPGGVWQDTCTLAPDGRSYTGRNQIGTAVAGRLVGRADPPAAVAVAPKASPPAGSKLLPLPAPPPTAAPKPSPPPAPQVSPPPASATVRPGPPSEYARFARLFAMDWGSSVTQEYRLRTAPKRAELLASGAFTDPALRKAAADFRPLAGCYYASWAKKTLARIPEKEFDDLVGELPGLLLKSDQEFADYFAGELAAARKKEKQIWDAGRLGFATRAVHGFAWKAVLPLARTAAAPKGDTFPLRLGVMYVQNTSAGPLTNVTVAVETNATVELPGRGRPHVVFFERLDPGEWVPLPPWLVNKQWRGTDYAAGADVLRCSVWSDQASAEDVGFDLRQVRPAAAGRAAGWGLFPGRGFTGTYDTTTPWGPPPVPAHNRALTVAGGTWRGKDNTTGSPRQLVVVELVGPNFVAIDLDVGTKSRRVVEGRIEDGRIEWETTAADQGEPGHPHWGTVRDGKMELSYGPNRRAVGAVSLGFVEGKNRKP